MYTWRLCMDICIHVCINNYPPCNFLIFLNVACRSKPLSSNTDDVQLAFLLNISLGTREDFRSGRLSINIPT